MLPAVIKGHQVEVVKRYKYLRTLFDDKLDFEVNTNIIRGKALQHMHFLKKRCNFNIDVSYENVLYLFY